MANPNAAHEPSMEEILASIRQIISEDGGAGQPTIDGVRAVSPKSTERPREDGSMTLPEDAGDPETEEAAFRPGPEPAPAAEEPDPIPDEVALSFHARRLAAQVRQLEESADGALLSRESGEAISGAFGALAHTMLTQNARSLEDVVTEMLEPMLKQWLDDNLPSIVERKVQEEIERVSRGRR
jgi:cell pole-organizing protein PopZ